MDDVKENFTLESRTVGVLPIINDYLERLRVHSLLQAYLEEPDPRSEVSPQKVLLLLVRNLVVDRQPLYNLSTWARSRLPATTGLTESEIDHLNDDRVGRALDRLFDADRAAMLTELVLHMLQTFDVQMHELHNDSTSLTLHGAYRDANGEPMRGKDTVQAARGYNKDHRPDLKQLLWILTISSDGNVPVYFKVCSGQTEDSSTHLDTWNRLRDFVGHPDFVYVADSKLCTRENLRYIDGQSGKFVTILPRSRKEDARFRAWLVNHTPHWDPIVQRPDPRRCNGPPEMVAAQESPIPEIDGFRLVWFLSSWKMERDAEWREACLSKTADELDAFQVRLSGRRCRFRSKQSVSAFIESILAKHQTADYVRYQIRVSQEIKYHTVQRGPVTRKYRRGAKTRFTVEWKLDSEKIRAASRSDGVFPLVTNCREWSALDVFNAYKTKQPAVEKRHDLFKNILETTPVYLKNIGRLEALLFLEFIALMVHALLERQLRKQMVNQAIETIPLYPEARACKAPTAERLIELFEPIQAHRLKKGQGLVQIFPPELSDFQKEMVSMAGPGPDVYDHLDLYEIQAENA